MHQRLAEKIAGEITLSAQPGETIRKWRNTFEITQLELAQHLKLSSSVISDYESGRRKSPGVNTVKKIVQGFMEIDIGRGGNVIKKYSVMSETDAIIDIKEFPRGILTKDFIKTVDGELLSHSEEKLKDREHKFVNGYTVIDSLRAITTFSSSDYLKVYGWSTQRALVFTDVEFGRSPMIAIRAHPLKPTLVMYLQPKRVDKLAIKLSQLEDVLLCATYLDLGTLLDKLNNMYKVYVTK